MQSAQHLIELCPEQLVNIIDIQFTGLKYCTTSDSAVFIGIIFIRQTGNYSKTQQVLLRFSDFRQFPQALNSLPEGAGDSFLLWHGTGSVHLCGHIPSSIFS